MGYLGFGLQKWIYKQKPRKPFSKERKPIADSTQSYHNEFDLKRDLSYDNKKLKAVITLLILAAFVWGAVILLKRAESHTTEYNKEIQATIDRKETEHFNVLFKSGKSYFDSKNLESAKSEFELALKIKPNSISLNKYYLSTLLLLSEKDSAYSEIALKYINRKTQEFPENAVFRSLKEQLITDLNRKN